MKFTLNYNMNMKNLLKPALSTLLVLVVLGATAQPPKNADKLKQDKIEYIKKRLALTASEEKAFIPVYEKFLDEMFKYRKEGMEMIDSYDLTFADDAEAEKMAQNIITYSKKEADILSRNYAEFKKVLTVKKAAMVFKIEHDFKKQMLKGFRRGGSLED